MRRHYIRRSGLFILAGLALVAGHQSHAFAQSFAITQQERFYPGAHTFDDAMNAFNYGDNQLASKYLWPIASMGDARAQYYLAYLLDTGQGIGKDIPSAITWYRKSAMQDYLPALVYMGYVYSTGHGVVRDDKEAFKWYTRAAQMGDAVAQNNLAAMLRAGQPYKKDLALAAQWFLQAAMQNNVRAQYNLATLYHTGEGAPKNQAESIKWYTYAANQGDMYAQSALAYMYRKGEGVAQSDSTALEWYRRAAEQGHIPSQYTLAKMYENGEGDATKGPADASIWYFHAAQKGLPQAQHHLGLMYETGVGLPQDDKEAVRWYKTAADDSSYQPAMVSLGHLYEVGSGARLKPNLQQALEWYQKAANLGNGEAQMNVGRFLRDGLNGNKDLIHAYQWFALAADNLEGDLKSSAVMARIQVSNMLTPDQLMTARSSASLWMPHPDTRTADQKPAGSAFSYQ